MRIATDHPDLEADVRAVPIVGDKRYTGIVVRVTSIRRRGLWFRWGWCGVARNVVRLVWKWRRRWFIGQWNPKPTTETPDAQVVPFGKRRSFLQFRVVLAISVVDILGPPVVDQDVVQQVGIAARLEPDVGQFAPEPVPRVFVAFQIDRCVIVVEAERKVGEVRGFFTTTVLLILRLGRISAIDTDTIGNAIDQYFERVTVDQAHNLGFLDIRRNGIEPERWGKATARQFGTGFAVAVGVERIVRLGVTLENRLCPFPSIKVSTRIGLGGRRLGVGRMLASRDR